jgi:hypothetical protein
MSPNVPRNRHYVARNRHDAVIQKVIFCGRCGAPSPATGAVDLDDDLEDDYGDPAMAWRVPVPDDWILDPSNPIAV